jgi:hypothetical protein
VRPVGALPAGDHGYDPYLAGARKWTLHTAPLARVDPIDIHVEMAIQLSSLVEEEVREGQCAQRFPDVLRLDVEASPTLRLRREHGWNLYLDHVATSTDRIGGRCRIASTQLSPSVRAKNEPLWVPK